VEQMRKKFASVLPEIEILSGTAENIPAPDSSFGAVVAAQAFHWFASHRALREIHRILRPHGKLGLVWNLRDESSDWVSELSRILDVHEADIPRYKTGAWKKVFDQTPIFTPLEKRSFKYNQKGNIETVLDLVRSRSYIAALPDETREMVLKKVVALLKKHPQTKDKDEIIIPYSTEVYWCSKK